MKRFTDKFLYGGALLLLFAGAVQFYADCTGLLAHPEWSAPVYAAGIKFGCFLLGAVLLAVLGALSKRESPLFWLLPYVLVWLVCVLMFWLGAGSDAMGYSILVLYLILPVCAILFSVPIGRSCGRRIRLLAPFFFGFLYMLAPYATFSLANTAAFRTYHSLKPGGLLAGAACSAAGMLLGAAVRRRGKKI